MAWIAVVQHLAAQVWEQSPSWWKGMFMEVRAGHSQSVESCLELPFPPPCLGCTDVPKCSIQLRWEVGICLCCSEWQEQKSGSLWTDQTLCKQRVEMQNWRSFLQIPCAKPGRATAPWAAGWGNERAFFNAWVWCISGGINPNSPLLVDLECNSTCLNGDGFQIYSGAGEKREKIMHRVGGSWEELRLLFSFLPQFFNEKSCKTAASSLPMQIETN